LPVGGLGEAGRMLGLRTGQGWATKAGSNYFDLKKGSS
jgi:hypothetical protein